MSNDYSEIGVIFHIQVSHVDEGLIDNYNIFHTQCTGKVLS